VTPDVIIAFVILIGVVIVLLMLLAELVNRHDAERKAWAAERQKLVDRAIARHAGEVIAFDRDGKPKPEREEASPVYVEGLS